MTNTENYNFIFNQAIADYHVKDHVDTPINNPYQRDTLENRLYLKCWIDTVQWHLEDLIRDPHIDPVDALALKRRIDSSNQDRTDLVEQIDSYYRQFYSTASPSWHSKSITCESRWSEQKLPMSTVSAVLTNGACSANSRRT